MADNEEHPSETTQDGGAPRRRLRLPGNRAGYATLTALALVCGGLVLKSVLGNKPTDRQPQPTPPARTLKPHKEALPPIPTELPAAVARQADTVLKVQYGKRSGSAVKVGHNLAFTVGHVVIQDAPATQIECSSSFVTGASDRAGQRSSVSNWSADYDWKAGPTKPDIALLRLNPDQSFGRLRTARLARRQPQPGTAVYFMNYQKNEADGSRRFPNPQLAAEFPTLKSYGYPAQFKGVILGHQGDLLEVATSLRSYDPRNPDQKDADEGGSGGPVFDGSGEVVGLDVESYGETTVSRIYQSHNIRLLPDGDAPVKLELIQPVTQDALSYYQEAIPVSAQC